MRLYIYIISVAFLLMSTLAVADTYPEVVFDNSLVKGSYAKSRVTYEGKSWVENVNGNLLVSDTLFYTPGNSLSLKYISNYGGNWSADVLYGRQKYHYRLSDRDILSFKLYIKSPETVLQDLPKVTIHQRDSQSLSLDIRNYVEDFNPGFWIDVKIPIEDFAGVEYSSPIQSVTFSQSGNASDKENHLFIDQIEFLPLNYPKAKLTSAAILSEVKAYQNHAHLKWRLPLTPSIRYVKIYRSEDNENFDPIGIRPVFMQSCLDYIPEINKKYYYKIAWVDYQYVESPFSEVIKVEGKALDRKDLLNLIQLSHVNYFVENFDVNSGLFMPFRMKDKALVSVKESGYAVLNLLIGAERNFVSRSIVMNRISKMVYFLLKAQNNEGIFPAYFDGRKGLPDYFYKLSDYDVNATATMMEALLVARIYFSGEDPAEKDLRNRISTLWERINWQAYTYPSNKNLLIKSKGYLTDSNQVDILGGINESMNTYFLAMSSPKFALNKEAFNEGVCHTYDMHNAEMDSLYDKQKETNKSSLDERSDDSLLNDSLYAKSIYQNTDVYGISFKLNNYKDNLLTLYRPFMTIDPASIQHNGVNYKEEVQKAVMYRKRDDNEYGVGSKSTDLWGTYQSNDSIQDQRINPAISIASVFVQPEDAMRSIEYFYTEYGKELFSEYGFRSWIDLSKNDISEEFQSLNQATIAIMIENARSGFIWDLYKEIPELKDTYSALFGK